MRKNKLMLILVLSVMLFGCEEKHEKKEIEKVIGSSKFLDERTKPIIDNFFAEIKSGSYNKALHELLSQNENIDMQDSMTIHLQDRFRIVNEGSGKFVSGRLVRKKALGDDLGIYIYIAKYDRKFYRFSFSFYNNGASVRIYKFAFDDVMDIELEDGMKLYVD